MSRLEHVLNETLEGINKNNSITVSFSDYEKKVIETIMKQYSFECVKASLEKASEKAVAYKQVSGKIVIAIPEKESITNPDNIVIL